MSDIDHLILVFDAFVAATGLAEATVSSRFLNGGGRISALRNGKDMGSRTISRVIESFSASWPENATWPATVPRPTPTSTGDAA